MDIRQCSRCAKLFSYRGNRNCPECVQAVDKLFVDVRNYLDEHPTASIEDICEDCGVEESFLLGWLREGRLIRSTEGVPLIKCQRCGVPIKGGRYCDGCAVSVIHQLEGSAQDIGQRESSKVAPIHTRLS